MQNKYYFNLNNENMTLEKAVAEFKAKLAETPDLKFVVLFRAEKFLKNEYEKEISPILFELDQHGIQSQNIIMSISDPESVYSIEQWQLIRKVDEFLKKRNITLGFEDMEYTWSIDEVENANSQIAKIASKIKEKSYSPYEKLLSAYLDVTRRQFVSEGENEHYSQSRSVYGVLNSNKIVCVGFAKLFEEIIQQVGDENIKIFRNFVEVSHDGETISGGHQNLIVYIKDEKYKINGFFYLDPTWDCATEEVGFGNLNYFMLPLEDVSKIKSHILGEWALSSYKQVEKSQKRKQEKQVIYHSPKTTSLFLGFNRGKLEYSLETLEKIMEINPEFKKGITKLIWGEEIVYILNDYTKKKKELKLYKQLSPILAEYSDIKFDYEQALLFKKGLISAINTGDTSQFLKLIEDLSKQDKTQNALEGFLSGLNEELEMFIYDFNTEEEVAEKKEKIASILSQTKELFVKNPDNLLKLAQMRPALQSYLFEQLINVDLSSNFKDFQYEIESTLDRVKIVKLMQTIQENIESIQHIIEVDLKILDDYRSLPIEVIINNAQSSGKLTADNVKNLMLHSGDPIQIEKVATALKSVLKSEYHYDSEVAIEKDVKKIISMNCENAKNSFVEGATNAFSKNPPTKASEMTL